MILDVGCGAFPKGKRSRDVNVDLFLEPVQAAEKEDIKPKEVPNFVLADAHFLPFRDNVFTVVHSSHLLEHLVNPFNALLEFKRVSKAVVYVEVPCGSRTPNDCPYHLYSWDYNTFRNLLKKIFPHVKIYTAERIVHDLRRRRIPLSLIGDVLLLLIKKLRYTALWRMQLTAICYKYPCKFVYTVCDKKKLVKEIVRSLKSIRRFIEKEHIIVFYTPPRSEKVFKMLSRYAVVKPVPNITKPFVFAKERGAGRYGEKIHVCDVDCPNVIFLDCDTIIKKNPLPLLVGDFDVAVRAGTANERFNREIWEKMFRSRGADPIPMPSAAFIIFKNYAHKDIKNLWLSLTNSELENPHPEYNLKEQYALALALAITNKKIKWLSKQEYAFRFRKEDETNAYVVHVGSQKLRRKLIPYKLRRILRKIVEYWRKDKVNFVGWIIALIGWIYFFYWYFYVYLPSVETEFLKLWSSFLVLSV